jgi:WD40 repeat protein
MGATLYDVASGRRLWTGAGDTTCLAFSPQGALVAACRGGALRVIDSDGREQATWSSTAGQDLCGLAISSDGSRLAAACESGQVLLCRIPDDKLIVRLHGHGEGTLLVAFSPDGKTLASGGTGGQIRLWDPVTGPERARLAVPQDVMRLSFAPDSSALAALTDDGSIHVWHTRHQPATP